MSDDIFSVATTFPDVASLAQGYMNRADGERLLLPLPSASREGSGVRFVVYLADGTPAFAGSGLCVQVSDQGNTVPPEARHETLLDTLQFDERSRPVYDYIVAVRNAAYAQQQTAPEDEGVESDGQVAVVDEAAFDEAAPTAEHEAPAEEVSAELGAPEDAWQVEAEVAEEPAVADEPAYASVQPAYASVQPGYAEPEQASMIPHFTPEMASFIPPPLPTGLLTRPARTTHWQPSAPRRPTPRPSTGLFRYGTAGLPRPARPPYPELDRAAWVEPAPRPAH